MSQSLRVGYVATYATQSDAGPLQLPGMRGAAFHLARELTRHGASLEHLGPLSTDVPLGAKLKVRFERFVLKSTWFAWLAPKVLDSYARQLESRLAKARLDVLFCPQNFWPYARLSTHLPKVLWTDAPFGALLALNGYFGRVRKETARAVLAMERETFEKCQALVFPSEWAADRARELYDVPREKLFVIPFGANLPEEPSSEQVLEMIDQRSLDECRLLYIGIGWQRKGLMTAVETTLRLREHGISTRLTVVGDFPHGTMFPACVDCLGPIDRSNPLGWARLRNLLEEHHFFILPTQADISPFVLCESSAFGLPGLSTTVGGIPYIVCHGNTGYLFEPTNHLADDFCQAIRQVWPQGYREMARNSRIAYEKRLNWRSSSLHLVELLDQVVNSTKLGRANISI